MRDSDADIAIDVLNKLIDQELKAASAGMRDGNRILEECASTRYHAYTFARDEIRKALADRRGGHSGVRGRLHGR